MTKRTRLFKILISAFFAATLIAATFAFSACSGQTDYFSCVSELRSDVFCGETDNFAATVYSGFKEKPYCHDGEKGETNLTLTVKLFEKQKIDEQIKIKIEYGGESYEKPLDYNPVSRALSCDAEVNSLPEKKLSLTVFYGETSVLIELESKLNPDTVSYTAALEKATAKATEFLRENSRGGVFNGEISIRLLSENERNYYYVGFIVKSGLKQAYLIDGKSGEILAEKKI